MTDLDDRARLRIENGVATITLNRPEAQNALDMTMANALAAALDQCEANEAVRAVILRGSGDDFTVGGDVPTLGALLLEPEGSRGAHAERLTRQAHQSILMLRRMPKPVIASIQGAAAGFGVSLALACDLALAAEDAVFTLAYCHIGATPDGGSTFHLPRAVGQKKAMEIALLGDRFSGAEAERLGLINRAVAAERLDEETARLAQRLAAGPTLAYGRTKQLLNAAFDQPLEGRLEMESECFAASTLTGDFAEGIGAFLKKRDPAFAGR